MQAPRKFELGQGIVFENDANSLSDMAEEVQERLHIQPPQTPSPVAQPSDSSDHETGLDPEVIRTHADQYCIYKEMSGKRELLFLIEYKAPHKLSINNLLMGFREMDLKKEVINQTDILKPIPKDKIDKTFKSN